MIKLVRQEVDASRSRFSTRSAEPAQNGADRRSIPREIEDAEDFLLVILHSFYSRSMRYPPEISVTGESYSVFLRQFTHENWNRDPVSSAVQLFDTGKLGS